MSKFKVLYESPAKCDFVSIKWYLKRRVPVWVVEPFHAYHHKKGLRFFPPHSPAFIQKLINEGKVLSISTQSINARGIYSQAADKAVDVIESVYSVYRERHEKIFSYVADTLKSSLAENVFKNALCNQLAEFYSVNILLHRIEKHFNAGPIVVYPDTNVCSYFFTKKLLTESNQEFFEHPDVRFPIQIYVTSFVENLKENLISTAKLCGQTFASGIWGRDHPPVEKKKKVFSYGVTVVGPRQLRGNKRGPDFIIDNKKIRASEVIYFPLMTLTKNQQKLLAKLLGEVHQLPKAGCFFSNYTQWKRLLYLGIKQKFLSNSGELMAASNVFFNYFRWQKVIEDVSVRHFITHCDFGAGHIGRNIALNQAGVQTWYFTDSMNHSVNFQETEKQGKRHPFWTYLYYDHLVTWDDTLVQYYKEHPGAFKQAHIVGCLWSEHIQGRDWARKEITAPALKRLDNLSVLSCFDSTYSRNGVTSYAEGLTFAKHLLQLADEYSDIYIILKEKKDRSIHYILDPILGPELLEIYNKMDFHPRIKICSNDVDASELISVSDMVISFPFTSTTFEALSTNKPAIWHDPEGHYRNTLYGKAGGVVTHSYEELKVKVLEIKKNPEDYKNPMPMNSPLMDPYRDKKAIDRFRELLTSK